RAVDELAPAAPRADTTPPPAHAPCAARIPHSPGSSNRPSLDADDLEGRRPTYSSSGSTSPHAGRQRAVGRHLGPGRRRLRESRSLPLQSLPPGVPHVPAEGIRVPLPHPIPALLAKTGHATRTARGHAVRRRPTRHSAYSRSDR